MQKAERMKTDADTAASLRLVLVYQSTPEWRSERHLFWSELIPELSAAAFQRGGDLDFSDSLVVEGGGDGAVLSNRLAQAVLDLAARPNTVVVCLLGDIYDECDLPLFLHKEEFDSIRSTLFEHNREVRVLTDSYVIDRSVSPERYRLSAAALSPSHRKQLIELLQIGAKGAFEEGLINQVNEARQQNFFSSPLHLLVSGLLALPADKSIFVCRKFETRPEQSPEKAAAIEKLKNIVSAEAETRTLNFSLPGASDAFFAGKDGDKYKDTLCRQLTQSLKERVYAAVPRLRAPPTRAEILSAEDGLHLRHATQLAAAATLNNKKVDAKLDKIISQSSGAFVLQGPPECGRSTCLARMWEMVGKRKPNAIRVVRFLSLSYASTLAHEIWHSICMCVCAEAGVDTSRLQSVLHLDRLLDEFAVLLAGISRPVFIFIDDFHLMRMGRLLSTLEKKTRKLPSNVTLVATALNIAPLPPVFPVQSTTNLDALSDSDVIDILKKAVPPNRRLSSENWGIVKQQVLAEGGLMSIGRAVMEEILVEGESLVTGGLTGRLSRIECRFGALPVQQICRLLAVSLRGLTRLEIHDLLSSNRELLESLGKIPCFPPLLLDDILTALGGLVTSILMDGRFVLRWSCPTAAALVRARYVRSSLENRAAHSSLVEMFSECLGEAASLSPRAALLVVHPPFPQALKRDSGTVNLRRIRNLWYNLLHSGNMDALKELSLCNFDYMDSVMRGCGVSHVLGMYEECLLQVLHHDIQVLAEQVLLPALETIIREPEQAAAEVIGRLRYTRSENSHFLNGMVEQAMAWVDTYSPNSLLVPLSCWIAPPEMSLVLTFSFKDWKKARILLTPTFNHQHILVTGNDNAPGDIYMVHIASQLLFATFIGHTEVVTSICESREGEFFTTTSTDKTVRIWSKTCESATKVLRPHSAKILCSALSSNDDFLVTGGADSCAKVISLATGEVTRSFSEHTGSVVSLQITSDNEFVITGSGDFVVQIWDIKNGRLVSRLGGLMAPVTCIALTSNDAFCAVACEDETLRVFSTVSSQELHDLSGHDGKVNTLVASHDDCQLFAATVSRIFCYDVHTGQIVLVWDTETTAPVSALQITRDNFFLISGCGSAVHVWHIRERNLDGVDSTLEAEGHVTAIALSPDEKLAACGTFAGIIAIWDLDIAQCVGTVVHSKRVEVSAMAFSVDSNLVLSGNAAGNICVVEANHCRVLRSIQIHSAELKAIASVDSSRALSVDKTGILRVWEIFEDEEEVELRAEGVLPPLFVCPANKLVVAASAGNSKELKICSLETNALTIRSKLSHNEAITSFSASPSGAIVVTASADCSLKIWQMESGFLTQVLAGHEAAVTCCAMAEDGRVVVSGGSDGRLILWSVSTGQSLFCLRTASPISAVAITSDASVAFCGDEDGWIEAWSCSSGQLLSCFNAHRPINAIIRSFDANRLILRVPGCAQLPILCLHNTPAGSGGSRTDRMRSARKLSIASLASTTSEGKLTAAVSSTPMNGGGGPSAASAASPRTPGIGGRSSTFDKLERSKSRASIGVEKEKSTQLSVSAISTSAAAPSSASNSAPLAAGVTRSRFCSIQ